VHAGSDPLSLLERARYLARRVWEGSTPQSNQVAQPPGVGEKGDKGEKSPAPTRYASHNTGAGAENAASDPEVAWRLEAMRKQIPPKGPMLDLIARDAPRRPDACFSCGDPLSGPRSYRCHPCAVAAAIAVWGYCPDILVSDVKKESFS
jgi:hypothetical protein